MAPALSTRVLRAAPRAASDDLGPTRKAILVMTTHTETSPPRYRLKAKLIGLGLDDRGGMHRIITGKECLVVGGSEQTHAELLETMIRLESELRRSGRNLADLPPDELAEIGRRIDSPELLEIADRIASGLSRLGRAFADSNADELTRLAAG